MNKQNEHLVLPATMEASMPQTTGPGGGKALHHPEINSQNRKILPNLSPQNKGDLDPSPQNCQLRSEYVYP